MGTKWKAGRKEEKPEKESGKRRREDFGVKQIQQRGKRTKAEADTAKREVNKGRSRYSKEGSEQRQKQIQQRGKRTKAEADTAKREANKGRSRYSKEGSEQRQ